MLTILHDLPPHVVGVRATGSITKQDLDEVLKPALDAVVQRVGKINYLLLLETNVSNFTFGALVDDVSTGLKHFNHWRKIAIVTNEKLVEKFSDAFSWIVPGECRGFTLAELAAAKEWITS